MKEKLMNNKKLVAGVAVGAVATIVGAVFAVKYGKKMIAKKNAAKVVTEAAEEFVEE